MNITTVRTTLIAYMWYSYQRKPFLLESNFDGFAMIYHAPKPPPPSNWMYSLDFIEGFHNWYDTIICNRVDPDEMFVNKQKGDGLWKIEHELHIQLPPKILAEYNLKKYSTGGPQIPDY